MLCPAQPCQVASLCLLGSPVGDLWTEPSGPKPHEPERPRHSSLEGQFPLQPAQGSGDLRKWIKDRCHHYQAEPPEEHRYHDSKQSIRTLKHKDKNTHTHAHCAARLRNPLVIVSDQGLIENGWRRICLIIIGERAILVQPMYHENTVLAPLCPASRTTSAHSESRGKTIARNCITALTKGPSRCDTRGP